MLEHVGQFGIHQQNLAADKAYRSGEFWLGSWRVTFSRTFRLSIRNRPKDASEQNIFTTSQMKMRTTVPKEHCCYWALAFGLFYEALG
jgi:hypothetical protein